MAAFAYYFAAPLGFYFVPVSDDNKSGLLQSFVTYACLATFVVAGLTQSYYHWCLARVKGLGGNLGKYGVPRGGLFEYVACPHYLCEIIVYACLVSF